MKRAEAARRPSVITVGRFVERRGRKREKRLAVGRAVGAEDSQLKACVRVRAKAAAAREAREMRDAGAELCSRRGRGKMALSRSQAEAEAEAQADQWQLESIGGHLRAGRKREGVLFLRCLIAAGTV